MILKKKKFGSKGKIGKCRKKFLTHTLAKSINKSKNIFAYSLISEHSMHFFFILRKKIAFFSGGRRRPLRMQVFLSALIKV